jgi:uncharacterized repeat protein (TIGR02543 family)
LLTVVSSPEGAGTFDLDPSPSSEGKYTLDTNVTVTAIPSPGFRFDHWEGDVTSSANSTALVVMDGDKEVIALFEALPGLSLVVNTTPPGGGTVTLSPQQPDDGYLMGDNVTLTAEPDPGYVFSGWQGGLTGTDKTQNLTMSENTSVTAVFNPTAQVVCGPLNGGTVTLEPGQPPEGYPPGTEVSILAVAAEGYRFVDWSGDLSGSDNPRTITIDTPRSITANFVAVAPFPWQWVVIGIAGASLVAFLAYFLRSELSKR